MGKGFSAGAGGIYLLIIDIVPDPGLLGDFERFFVAVQSTAGFLHYVGWSIVSKTARCARGCRILLNSGIKRARVRWGCATVQRRTRRGVKSRRGLLARGRKTATRARKSGGGLPTPPPTPTLTPHTFFKKF